MERSFEYLIQLLQYIQTLLSPNQSKPVSRQLTEQAGTNQEKAHDSRQFQVFFLQTASSHVELARPKLAIHKIPRYDLGFCNRNDVLKTGIASTVDDLKPFVRDIPDFPKPGINFKDITPLLLDKGAFRTAVQALADRYRDATIDVIVAAEARGFILAAPLAYELGIGFVPIRKPGKLPFDRHSHSYELEYGTDTLEMHVDGVEAGQQVLVVDDLLATGGTVGACCQMIAKCDAHVHECAFLIELEFLEGAQRLRPAPVFSLIKY